MKKNILILVACLLPLVASAQSRKYSDNLIGVDVHAGNIFGDAGRVQTGADFVFSHKFAPDFALGVGAGLDYINAHDHILKVGKDKEAKYQSELSLPIFLRGRYIFGQQGYYGRNVYDKHTSRAAQNTHQGWNVFAQVDAGYRMNLGCVSKNDGSDSGFGSGHVKGFFAEPQFGVSFGRNLDFAVGLPLQAFEKNIIDISNIASSSSVTGVSKNRMYSGLILHLVVAW